MTRQQAALYFLLAAVACSAAILSFDALRQLALVCGFDQTLAPLLPATIDAGAAAGSIAWLASWTPAGARRYGRALALVLLASSVGGNALGHGLQAYGLAPHWLVVVGVSAIAPAVLGALVHLLVIIGRPAGESRTPGVDRTEPHDFSLASTRPLESTTPPISNRQPEEPPALEIPASDEVEDTTASDARQPGETDDQWQARLLADGAGRPRLMAALEITDWQARQLLTRHRAREKAQA